MSLRPYQEEAITNALRAFESGQQRTALVLATGAGKTVIFADLIRRWVERHPGQPVIVLAHRSELLSQAAQKIRFWAAGLRVGLVQAGVNQVWANVIVASQQTLSRSKRLAKIPPVSLVVVDECHRSMSPSYARVLEELGCLRPDGPRVLGVTATFTREDSKRLTDFWQSCAYSIDILDLIDPSRGKVDRPYLVPPKFRRVLVEGLDLTAVKSSRMEGGKDLAAGDLDKAMERAGAPGVVAAAYRMHAADRQGLVFTPTVHSAELVRDALRGEGITSEVLSGTTPTAERAAIIRRYSGGQLQTVVNCAVLTEGFDAPATSCVLIARPTMSKILFRQMVGRALRLHPGKTDALILDVVGATGRNDLRTLNDVTDLPVHVREDELLTDAVKREQGEVIERLTPEGDALVSGSLATAEMDPWDLERRSKMTQRERDLEDAGVLEELTDELEPEDKPEPVRRRRYQHVEFRSGWFLRSPGGVWFVPVEPNHQQRGFVTVVPGPDGHTVALSLPGVDWQQHLTTCDTAEDAAQLALDLTLGLVTTGEHRSRIDPDARWRRNKVTQKQLNFLGTLGVHTEEEPEYSGQAADLITVAKTGPAVDLFVHRVASYLTTVLVSQSATTPGTMTEVPNAVTV
jgi:superfamily II DNA or RNA helicase